MIFNALDANRWVKLWSWLSQDTSELPLYERRHRILLTVTDEGATKRGEKAQNEVYEAFSF